MIDQTVQVKKAITQVSAVTSEVQTDHKHPMMDICLKAYLHGETYCTKTQWNDHTVCCLF